MRAERQDRLLVADIETVPATPPDWPADRFPKPAFHRVVAVSYVLARIERDGAGERYRVERIASGGEPDWDEARLIGGFWRLVAFARPRLVGWNSRRFDMPVLRLRAMVHRVAVPAWYAGDRWAGYHGRFADSHVNVMERLSDDGATTSMGMEETALLLGLPPKLVAHGAGVADLVGEGRLEAVRAYCETDACLNYVLFLRWAHHCGTITTEAHDAAVDDLLAYLDAERARRPHLGAFVDHWSVRHVGCAAPPDGEERSAHQGTQGPGWDAV